MAAYEEGAESQAFVTLATTDAYALGAMVLAHSLRQANTTRKIVCMITDQITQPIRDQMDTCFDELVTVNVFDSRDTTNLGLLGRADLGETFTKFHCWRLTHYTKGVFLDADTLVLQNVDELFDREELSAAPDAGWPDCFNSGVFVFKPSLETYQAILAMALTVGSFDGGDQGLLNLFFKDWATKDIAKHLPFVYNVVSQAFYSYLPAFRQFGKNTKIVHFIGAVKPWHHTLNRSTGGVQPSPEAGHNAEFLQMWWDIFMTKIQPYLNPELSHLLRLVGAEPAPPPEPHYDSSHYCMTSPYIPPVVDQTFFTPPATDSETEPTLIVVDNRDDRPYSHFETFYSEPPMRDDEGYTEIEHVYEAPQFTQHWTEFTESRQELEQKDEQISEVKDEWQEEVEEETWGHKEPEVTEEGSKSDDSNMGIVGQLASLRLEGTAGMKYTPEELSDRQRQYAWERGQVDYQGKDVFQNIISHIETMLNGGKRVAPISGMSAEATAIATAKSQKSAPESDAPAQ